MARLLAAITTLVLLGTLLVACGRKTDEGEAYVPAPTEEQSKCGKAMMGYGQKSKGSGGMKGCGKG